MNTPDRWLVLKIPSEEKPLFKILAGWSGSYTGSDSWQINSGITNIIEGQESFTIEGYSGSVYRCHKGREGMTSLMASVLATIKEHHPEIKVVPIEEAQQQL